MGTAASRTTSRVLILLAFAVFGLGVVEMLVVGPELPTQIATHFGGSGQADAWSSRRSAFVLSVSIGFLTVGGLCLVPALVRRTPISLVNLPHRDYWLAPEQREETLGYLSSWCAGLAVATSAFFVWTQHLVLAANRMEEPRLPGVFVWGLGGFLLAIVAGCVVLFRRFRKPTPG